MVKIDFNLKKIFANYDKALVRWINKATAFRKPFIEDISPVDTGDYITSHKIRPAKVEWDSVVGSNFNDSDNAFGVENWFGSSEREVNWSKKDGTLIINWVGAKVMQRITDDQNIRNQVLWIIAKELAWS